MDCFDIQALGDDTSCSSSSTNSDYSSSSESSTTDKSIEHDQANKLDANQSTVTNSYKDQKEELYTNYKSALMLISQGDFLKAEELFEQLIESPLMKDLDINESDSSTRDHMQLKYLVLKNLSLANSKNRIDFRKSLNYLIEAASIDSSDSSLWFEIGELAFKLSDFILARWAYEQSLRLNESNWPCLDNLIVVLFSLGNYSQSLKYILDGLSRDKFYFNGLLLMQEIEKLNEFHYMQQIEIFKSNFYESFHIDVYDLFANFDDFEMMSDRLAERIESIRSNYQEIFHSSSTDSSYSELTLSVSKNLNTWDLFGKCLLSANQQNENKCHLPVKLVYETESKDESIEIKETKETNADSEATTTQESCPSTPKSSINHLMDLSNSRSIKRKKFDLIQNNDHQLKRRSLRKEKDTASSYQEMNISMLLKKYIGKNYLSDVEISSPIKLTSDYQSKYLANAAKSKDSSSLKSKSTASSYQLKSIQRLIERFKRTDGINLLHMTKSFLNELATNYQQKWSKSLEEVYLNLFNIVNAHSNYFDKITYAETDENFLLNCSVILVYLEIEFSKYKEIILKPKFNQANQNVDVINEKYLHQLYFNLETLRIYYEKFSHADNKEEKNQYFMPRMNCLGLFACLYLTNETHRAEYYKRALLKYLSMLKREMKLESISIPNSKIFCHLSEESIREFFKSTRKHQILKSTHQIQNLFNKKKYDDIVESLEEFAETHKLILNEANFKPDIYLLLLESYWNLNQFEKFGYFARKFLRQVIDHIVESEKSTNQGDDDNESECQKEMTDTSASPLKKTDQAHNYLSMFINQLLECIDRGMKTRSGSTTNGWNDTLLHETIHLMYQLVNIFYSTSSTGSLFKPIKPFIIIYECLEISGDEISNRIEYLSSIHEFLANDKNKMCSTNDGEFLFWSVDMLMRLIEECEDCNDASNLEDEEQSTSKNPRASAWTSNLCSNCGESNDMLKQLFNCIFGYKTRTAKNARLLNNHQTTRISFSLDNSMSFYKHFKPRTLPEYDDLPKFSISSELYEVFNELKDLAQQKRLIHVDDLNSNDELIMSICEQFKASLEKEDFNDSLGLLQSLKEKLPYEEYYADIYYLLGDYNFKNYDFNNDSKESKLDSLLAKNIIQDLIFNPKRFDSWTILALSNSECTLNKYLEEGIQLSTQKDFDDFTTSVSLSINLFKKSIELVSKESKIIVEYGSFLYQMHSYCSRQLKNHRQIKHFKDESLVSQIENKKIQYLKLALDIYNTLSNNQKKDDESIAFSSTKKHHVQKETTASEEDNDEENNETTQKEEEKEDDEEDNSEQWLYQYMLGKIKEKLHRSNLIESLNHYSRAAYYLEKDEAVYMKKLTYKSKGHLSVEANEVYYRIYSLTIKRIILLVKSRVSELSQLDEFLTNVLESKFVKVHNDLRYEEISKFLEEEIYAKSKILSNISVRDVLTKCITMCVAGLMQILRRFSQHYRSIHRLAKFYCKFLDFSNYEIAKNLLYHHPNWMNLVYMPCPGLFHERNKTNYFNGIWRISNNMKKDQDLEREGGFFCHLFRIVRLYIEVLDKLGDFDNLIELTRILFQKPDVEKKYLENHHREHLAYLSCRISYRMLREKGHKIFDNRSFQKIEELRKYQEDLKPIMCDSYEIYKIAVKHFNKLTADIENFMRNIFIQFHPEQLPIRDMINMDDIIKFCVQLERTNKTNRNKAVKNK